MSKHLCSREAGQNGDSQADMEKPIISSVSLPCLLLAWMFYGIAIWYSFVHLPKPHLLQRTPRHPAAAVMITLKQSRCPSVSGSQLQHHLSLFCKLSEKEKMSHYLVSVVSGLSSDSQACTEAQNPRKQAVQM